MRVLFVNFNLNSTPGINNGLAILSSVLKKKNHEVRLLFLCNELGYDLDFARIKKDVLDSRPDIIGISLMETQLKHMKAFLKNLRKYYKGLVVCGGPHPTMNPEDVLSIKGIDVVCVGEGEGAILEFIEALKAGRDYKDIKNLWFNSDNGKIIKNRLRFFTSLETLPPEDKELFDLDKLLPLKNYQLEVMLGRGCMYQCTYCINKPFIEQYRQLCENEITAKDYMRVKKSCTVIEEIKNSVLRHPEIKKIAFIDDDFLMYTNFANDFFEKYKKEINLPFMCNINPVSFNVSKGHLLKEAGCDDIRFGVESGSERVKNDIMKRPIRNRSIISAFNITKKLGLMTSSFNMIGLPTETKEEILETLKLNAAIGPDSMKVMTFYPFKNTPLYDVCREMDLIDEEKKMELDNYDTFTCLRFPAEHQLFLRKVQSVFNWYINAFLENEASGEYSKMIRDVEKMTESRWDKFDHLSCDKELSEKMRRKNAPHYSKFVNRSLAVKYPSKHCEKKR
ncbi:MAG: B12-binding domain-containing radical SAM protein [Candidatus Omnitrophica bacterium]|nr:B12-binding domain-containing radical SAM protein [Candidatus Omnitrophota bacterium]